MDVVLPSSMTEDDGTKLLEVEVIDGHEESLTGQRDTTKGKRVYIPYDRLIIACGSVSNDHGVPGLENCFQLKTIKDARAIRSHILGESLQLSFVFWDIVLTCSFAADNLEIAALPTTTEEERDRLLSFVVW
jgi:Pyridine nucleotide-disulphide oxidoreductase